MNTPVDPTPPRPEANGPAQVPVPIPGPGPGPGPGPEEPAHEEAPLDLFARIRHDLRTPASHILGYAELVREQAEDLGCLHLLPDLEHIETAGRRLVELIRNELSPEKLARGDIDLRNLHAELRTPLNHAIGYSEMLLEVAERDQAGVLIQDLHKIRAAAGTFLHLAGSLLTPAHFATAESSRPAVRSAAHPDALALSRPGSEPAQPAVERLGGRILVADDDPGNRDLLMRRLSQQGFEVETVVDGLSALRRLAEAPFDLLLLDVVMPGPDGDEILARLKADPALRALPVIMLSALDEMDSVVRCILAGAEDYLAKPVNSVLLRARIGACLEKSRLRRKEQTYLEALEGERRKSEALLRNILPAPIAERLKRGETTIVDSLPEVTVLFADLVGFTEISSSVSSVEVVRLLDDIFSQFDLLAEAQGLEKIKTIGDAYMVVGGLPTPRPDHARAVAEVALNMIECVERRFAGHPFPVRIRLGMNTGPVIAGIIGRSKFSYDLWGDTVNLASRMESLSSPGCIQVTAAVHERLAGEYRFESRGDIAVKGRGGTPAWFLTGRRSTA